MNRYLILIGCLCSTNGLANNKLEVAKIDFLQSIIEQTYAPAMQKLLVQQEHLVKQLEDNCVVESKISDLQHAWSDAYSQWKQVESYILGPVTYHNLARQLGFWPTREAFLQRLVQGDQPIDSASLSKLNIASKGYPALEWIIFTQLSTDISISERQRYCDLSHLLVDEITVIIDEALLDYKDAKWLEAIQGQRDLTLFESIYSQQPFAEWISTIGSAQYDIRKLYLIKPAGLRIGTRAQPNTVDGYLSKRSLMTMKARWDAMKVIYLGGENLPSLSALVADYNQAAATKLKAIVDKIDQQMAQFPQHDLSLLAEDNPDVLKLLSVTMADLEKLLATQVASALNTQSFFSDDDGD